MAGLTEHQIRIIQGFNEYVPYVVRNSGQRLLSQDYVLKSTAKIIDINYAKALRWIKMFRYAQILGLMQAQRPAYFSKDDYDENELRIGARIHGNLEYRQMAKNILRWYEAAAFKDFCKDVKMKSKRWNKYQLDELHESISKTYKMNTHVWVLNLSYLCDEHKSKASRYYKEIAEFLRGNKWCVTLAEDAMSEYAMIRPRAVRDSIEKQVENALKTKVVRMLSIKDKIAEDLGTHQSKVTAHLTAFKYNIENVPFENVKEELVAKTVERLQKYDKKNIISKSLYEYQLVEIKVLGDSLKRNAESMIDERIFDIRELQRRVRDDVRKKKVGGNEVTPIGITYLIYKLRDIRCATGHEPIENAPDQELAKAIKKHSKFLTELDEAICMYDRYFFLVLEKAAEDEARRQLAEQKFRTGKFFKNIASTMDMDISSARNWLYACSDAIGKNRAKVKAEKSVEKYKSERWFKKIAKKLVKIHSMIANGWIMDTYCPLCGKSMTFKSREPFLYSCGECKVDVPVISARCPTCRKVMRRKSMDPLIFTCSWCKKDVPIQMK